MITITGEWADPIAYLAAIDTSHDCVVLLHSGMSFPHSGRYSFLAFHPKQIIEDSDFTQFANQLSNDQHCLDNAWFGYLGYGLKNQLEQLPTDQPGTINLPDLWMAQFNIVMVFDHKQEILSILASDETMLENIPKPIPLTKSPVASKPVSLSSNMTKPTYLEKVEHLQEAIIAGDCYEANLTRKFFGTLPDDHNNIDCFRRLCAKSPAPYSAYIKWDSVAIMSSSPERFLTMDSFGSVDVRPIKGSASRKSDPDQDLKAQQALKQSMKDRAENLMIVDLMRNDLSRSCVIGSVQVPQLFEVTTYSTVHHLSSTIKGQKAENVPTIELVKSCFPPGSMTGAPKIKAMEWCSQLEQHARGVYSGCIGWFGGDGSCDLSVVIRTIITKGNQFEFQVGGAITYDSTPEQEWEETMTKALGVASALNIPIDELEAL